VRSEGCRRAERGPPITASDEPSVRWYLDRIDYETRGDRCDVTPLFANPAAFDALVEDLVGSLRELTPTSVAGIDALGFILGTALARRLGVGLVAIRKGGKLPVPTLSERFVDYSGSTKSLEIRPDAVRAGDLVLLADEWIETGAQVAAAIRLIERSGGRVCAIATIHVDDSPSVRTLRQSYRIVAASEQKDRANG